MASGNWCGLGSTMTTKSSFFLLKLFMRDEVEVFAFKINLIAILGRVSSKLAVPRLLRWAGSTGGATGPSKHRSKGVNFGVFGCQGVLGESWSSTPSSGEVAEGPAPHTRVVDQGSPSPHR
jgi:hypothetical protein